MTDEAIELDERARVEQQLDPLAREELPALVLARGRLLRARVRRVLAQLAEPGELLLGRLVPRRHREEPKGRTRQTGWATVNNRHSPGIPLSSTAPRSSNGIPDPATSSFTVLDTTTSPGCALAATRAPM